MCKERPVGLLGQLRHVDVDVRVGRTGEGGGGAHLVLDADAPRLMCISSPNLLMS